MTTPKAVETRGRILKAALDLFHQKGFEGATLRDIAREAGVATGAAYYYFDSKEALVMAFYEQSGAETHRLILQALDKTKRLEERLRAVIATHLTYFEPHRDLLRALFRRAADPHHPLSPFGEQTRTIRETDIAHFSEALEGGDTSIPADLRPHLPTLLWLYQMGIILFWIYDRSPGQSRTADLLAKSLRAVAGAIKLSRLPLLRPLRKTLVELLQAAYTPEPTRT